jgi:hypothetical protein
MVSLVSTAIASLLSKAMANLRHMYIPGQADEELLLLEAIDMSGKGAIGAY